MNQNADRKKPARVLFLEHNVDGTVGGSHVCLLDICRNLDLGRYQPVAWFHEENPLIPAFREAGVEVVISPASEPVRLTASKGQRWLAPFMRYAQAALNAARAIATATRWFCELRRYRIDLVHLNNSCTMDHELIVAAWVAGVPSIAHQRGMPPRMGPVARTVARCFNRILAISSAVADHIVEQGAQLSRVKLIPDAIDPQRVISGPVPAELREARRQGRPIVGIVGNVKRWKGQEVVVRAIARVRETTPDVLCVIVGSPVDETYVRELQSFIESSGLQNNVLFAGFQPEPTRWMAGMDVVIHASIVAEPFGIVQLEAMALGKPVIASDLGGPREVVVEGTTGYRTPPEDSEALAERISELLANAAQRAIMGEAGRARFLTHYTIHTQLISLVALYDDVLNISAAPPAPVPAPPVPAPMPAREKPRAINRRAVRV